MDGSSKPENESNHKDTSDDTAMASSHPDDKEEKPPFECIRVSETKLKYCNTGYKKVGAKMYDYKCDVKLKVGTSNFKAHREVLSEASDYFAAMFGHNMREKEQDVIEFHEISPNGFAVILDYFYHGHVTLDPTNIEDVLEAARFFHAEWVVEAICDFLVRHLSLENYTAVLHLADKYWLGDLRSDIFLFLGLNLVSLAEQPGFFSNLSLDLLSQFLKENIYVDVTEEYLLELVERWVETDISVEGQPGQGESRSNYRAGLLRLIRFPLMEADYLERLPKSVMDAAPDIADAVEEAKYYNNNVAEQSLHTDMRFQCRGSKPMINLMTFSSEYNMVVYRDPALPGRVVEEELGNTGLTTDFEYSGTATIGHFLYATGGYDESVVSSKRMFRYDPKYRAWTELATMNHARVSHAICSSGTRLYVCGGVDHSFTEDGDEIDEIIRAVEMYCPKANAWSDLPPLIIGSYDQAVAFLNDTLYLSGGISGDPSDPVPQGALYRLGLGEEGWEPLPDMLAPRQAHSFTAHGGRLYAIGGTQGGGLAAKVNCLFNEVYEPETRQWTQLRDTPADLGRISRSVSLFGNKIYFFSNADLKSYLHSYNIETDEFEVGDFVGLYVMKLAILNVALPP